MSKPNPIDRIAVSFGSSAREAVELVGSIFVFYVKMLRAIPASLRRFHLLTEQMMILGVQTIPIVLLTSVFIGVISAWQVQYIFGDAVPLTYLGAGVGKAVFTELGPVLTALVVTGRIGAKLAAELGTMRVTEQVDAMVCLSLDPYTYLLTPRLIASCVMVPVLTTFAVALAIISAQVVAEVALGLSSAAFYKGVRLLFKTQDVMICLVKAFVFGMVISLSGCYYGFHTKGGAVGVGAYTKKAVVAAMIMVLVSNMILVNVLLS
ncbi:MAG: ABC transporter permease [Chitinispirillales bacterium]|jgi:phospholipid/cholesterol/gamma-HCH transport system permease protein|nr:ABC transporter permease [Chitinispirillales bacterium]